MSVGTPITISLNKARKTVIGRAVEVTGGDKHGVNLRSQRLPSMLSRRHASLTYHQAEEQWTIKDMKVAIKGKAW